jgi:hypothetical protein
MNEELKTMSRLQFLYEFKLRGYQSACDVSSTVLGRASVVDPVLLVIVIMILNYDDTEVKW